jgi:uncharacterized protein
MRLTPSLNRNNAKTDGATFRPQIKLRGFRGTEAAIANRHWVNGDPHATAFFNCLSAIFPQAETFMIRCLAGWVDKVPADLSATIRNFIEQEAGHSREHVAMNRALTDAGYDIASLEKAIRNLVDRFDRLNDVTKLTATICIEHLTAIVAAQVLESDCLIGSDAEMQEIWNWHCLEEVEHKAVAFDVWLYATRDYSSVRRWAVRSSFMTVITASFLVNRMRGQIALLRQDGFGWWAACSGALRFGFGSGGIGRKVVGPWAAFLKPGFQPWDIDDRHLIAKAEAQLAKTIASRKVASAPAERRKSYRLKKAA